MRECFSPIRAEIVAIPDPFSLLSPPEKVQLDVSNNPQSGIRDDSLHVASSHVYVLGLLREYIISTVTPLPFNILKQIILESPLAQWTIILGCAPFSTIVASEVRRCVVSHYL